MATALELKHELLLLKAEVQSLKDQISDIKRNGAFRLPDLSHLEQNAAQVSESVRTELASSSVAPAAALPVVAVSCSSNHPPDWPCDICMPKVSKPKIKSLCPHCGEKPAYYFHVKNCQKKNKNNGEEAHRQRT